MNVVEYGTAEAFLDATSDVLMENEASNAIIWSYADQQTQGVASAMSTRFYCVVDDDIPVLPAMFTPEVVPLLTPGPEEAARIFARYFFPKNPRPTGVNGPKDVALAFADEWERLTRCDLEIHHNARLYNCTSVVAAPRADGSSRKATVDDFNLIKRWRAAFRAEINAPVGTTDEQINRHIREGRYYLWTTDEPVSMALHARDTGNTGLIGGVYTPPEHRSNGFASAVTSAATQPILDSGKKYATLYTDLDNPTSNSIYQKIGYKPILDSTFWIFKQSI